MIYLLTWEDEVDRGVITAVVSADSPEMAEERVNAYSRERFGHTPAEMLAWPYEGQGHTMPPRLTVTEVTESGVLSFQMSNVLGISDGTNIAS